MSGALSTCMSVLEKETGRNVLSKNVCDLSRSVLYSMASDALVLLLGNYKIVAFVQKSCAEHPGRALGSLQFFLEESHDQPRVLFE